jgi:uncharacterized alpha-E superfamily protein
LDNYQWTTLLRALSAHRAFHWAYGGEVTPAKIAHFLILNPQCPRALVTCVQAINMHLDRLAKAYRRTTDAQAQARSVMAGIAEAKVEEIFDEGLHEFLTRFIEDIARIGGAVHDGYLSGDVR